MADLWSWNNAVDGDGTLISSTAGGAGALLTPNLRDPRVGKIWRSGGMPVTLNITLPSTAGVSVFGIFGHNYAEIGEMTLRLGTSEGSGNLWTTTFAPAAIGRQAVFILRDANGDPAPVEATHATIVCSLGAPLEIGRIWIGHADWAAQYGHSIDGSEWGAIDLSTKSSTRRSGAVLGDRGAVLRTFTANYGTLVPEEYAGSLFEMDARGTLQQMLYIPDPAVYDPNRFAVLGTLDEIPSTAWQAYATAGRVVSITESG